MAENRQGAKSLQEIAASEGTDAFARLEQIAAEAAYVKELSEKYGVPETAIRLTTPNLPATPVQAAAAGATIPVGPDGQPVNPEETPIDQTPTAIVDPSSEELATTEGGAPSPDRAKLIEVNFADGSYVPNNAMAANAKQALEVRASKPPSQRGMTAVGLARARDIQNKKPLSEETVRRMKAYFDRHEVDKKGSTWSEKGKGWQAWQGWGGDEGRTWANAIVERLNKQQTQNSANQPQRVELAARIEVEKALVPEMKPNAAQWLDAIIDYRRRFENKATEAVKPVTEGKTLIELSQKAKFDLPTPNMGETHDDFMTRCMSDAVAIKEFPDAAQRSAVCMRQHEGKLQKNS